MRSWSLVVAVTALLLAAGSLAVTVGGRSDHPAPRKTAPRPEAQTLRVSALEQGLDQALRELEQQRRETETLRELLDDLLASTPTTATAASEPATADESDTSLAALDPFGTGTETGAAAVPKKAEREIRAVLARVDDERRQEREKRQESRQRRRAERVIQDVRERLGLSEDQAQAMTEALLARDLGRRKAWSDDAAEVEVRRAAAATIDETYELALQQLLSPAQYEELQAVRKESASGGGGRRRQRRGRRAR